jgi:hypothetical protein
MRISFLIILFFVLISVAADSFCQNSNSKTINKYFSKIVIEKGDSMFVETDSLLVDTLIIRDHGSLNFLYGQSVLAVAHAFIGKSCHFNGFGVKGKNGSALFVHGLPGGDGKKLTVSIRFEELGSLYVNTSGGDGGHGLDGQNGLDAVAGQLAQYGETGGNGGKGGDGGNLNFFYLSPGFIIVFHEDRDHSVHFNCSPGKGGSGGRGGMNGRGEAITRAGTFTTIPNEKPSGPRGRDGHKGKDGSGGTLLFLKTGL